MTLGDCVERGEGFVELGEGNSLKGIVSGSGRPRAVLAPQPGLVGIKAIERAILGLEETQEATPAKTLSAGLALSDRGESRVMNAKAIHEGS
jgi:hypothetical protein